MRDILWNIKLTKQVESLKLEFGKSHEGKKAKTQETDAENWV